jgi:hypothetical protein
MRPAPPSIRPCAPMLRAPQKVCVGGFFFGQGAHSSHSWKVCVGFCFSPRVRACRFGQKNNPTPEGVRLLSFGLLFGCC